MPKKAQRKKADPVSELLKDLLIVELAKAGATQSEIRNIVGGDIVRVNRIARFFKKNKSKEIDKN